MEIDSRFWKIHKKSWKLKGILLRNGVVPFFHPTFQYKDTLMSNFGVFHIIFLYCDWDLVSRSQRQNCRGPHGPGLSLSLQYLSLSCHEACKRSLILKLWSWGSHGKIMEKILKFSGYTLKRSVTLKMILEILPNFTSKS